MKTAKTATHNAVATLRNLIPDSSRTTDLVSGAREITVLPPRS